MTSGIRSGRWRSTSETTSSGSLASPPCHSREPWRSLLMARALAVPRNPARASAQKDEWGRDANCRVRACVRVWRLLAQPNHDSGSAWPFSLDIRAIVERSSGWLYREFGGNLGVHGVSRLRRDPW